MGGGRYAGPVGPDHHDAGIDERVVGGAERGTAPSRSTSITCRSRSTCASSCLRARSDVSGAPVGSMGRTDEDTVNLVGMLFDYILNDRNLAIPMKALIGRLQIPMLKVAILDKTFFSRTSHPARQLVERTVERRDRLERRRGTEARRALQQDRVGRAACAEQLQRRSRDFRHARRRIAQVRAAGPSPRSDRRTARQRSRSRSRKDHFCETHGRTPGEPEGQRLRLPPEIGHFISDTWSRVLVYLCVRHGD